MNPDVRAVLVDTAARALVDRLYPLRDWDQLRQMQQDQVTLAAAAVVDALLEASEPVAWYCAHDDDATPHRHEGLSGHVRRSLRFADEAAPCAASVPVFRFRGVESRLVEGDEK